MPDGVCGDADFGPELCVAPSRNQELAPPSRVELVYNQPHDRVGHMSGASEKIDLDFRPLSYFGNVGPETPLLSHTKGAKTQGALKAPSDTGGREREISRTHPASMGGQYLPNRDEQEVEIARITISSTTSDVTSVYAQLDQGKIFYSVVDEYDGDTFSGPTECTSDKPLTLGEVVEFLEGAWPLLDVLNANFEGDLTGMLGFFRAESAFYPQMDALFRQRVRKAFSD